MLTTLMIIGQIDPFLDVWDRMESQAERKLSPQIPFNIFRTVEWAVYLGVEQHISNQLEEAARAH